MIGGSAGIGSDSPRARGEGAEVILVARNADRLKQAALELGAQATAALDATDTASLQEFFHNLRRSTTCGSRSGPHYGSLLEMNSEDVRHALGDHAALALQVARNAAPKRIRRNNTSDGGTPGRRVSRALGIVPAVTAALPPFTAALALGSRRSGST